MHAVIGTLCIVSAIVGLSFVMLNTRKPNPPAWAKQTVTHEVSAITGVALAGFGIGFVIQSIILFKQQPPSAIHVGLIGAILIAFIAVWVRLKIRKTLAEYEREIESAIKLVAKAAPASSTHPDHPTHPRTPSRPKKAA